MTDRNAHLIALMDAIVTGRTGRFAPVVQDAYVAGLSRDELLAAIEISRFLADVPLPVLTRAYSALSAWPVSLVRRFVHQPALAQAT